MSTATLQFSLLRSLRELLQMPTRRSPRLTPKVTKQIDEDRACREFVLGMMQMHPEAFEHEMDVQNMMHFYPSRL